MFVESEVIWTVIVRRQEAFLEVHFQHCGHAAIGAKRHNAWTGKHSESAIPWAQCVIQRKRL